VFQGILDAIRTLPEALDEVVSDNADILLSLNRDQILLGRDAEGNILAPSYLEDPYFKSPEAATAYARMKYALEPIHRGLIWNPVYLYPDKDMNTPNLIVTGSFQDRMFIKTSQGEHLIYSSYVDTYDINTKYNGKVFGLAPRSKEYFYLEYIRPALLKHLEG
jgi:hypothetical protein